ncbi:MAG: hypothetical protein ACOCZ8_01940 [Bacteroidota bacterium]
MTFLNVFFKHLGFFAFIFIFIALLQEALFKPVFGPDSFTPVESFEDLFSMAVVALAGALALSFTSLRNRAEGVLINLPCEKSEVKAHLEQAFHEVKEKKPGVWEVGKRTSGWRVQFVEHKHGQSLLHFTALYPLQILRSKPTIQVGKLVGD